jgi:hypothetical protein
MAEVFLSLCVKRAHKKYRKFWHRYSFEEKWAIIRGPGEMMGEFPPPDYGGERAKQMCAERGWNIQRLDANQEARLRWIIDNEQPTPKRVPRRAPSASERYAATAMAEAMSAAHAGGEYPDLPAGVGYSRFDHPGWS